MAYTAEEIKTRGKAANDEYNLTWADVGVIVDVIKGMGYPIKRVFIASRPVTQPHKETLYSVDDVIAAQLVDEPLDWSIQFEGSGDFDDRHSLALLKRALGKGSIANLRRLHDSISGTLPLPLTFEQQVLQSPAVIAAVEQLASGLKV